MLNKEWNDVVGGTTDEGVFYVSNNDWGLNVGYGEGCTGEGWLDLNNDEWPPV